MTMKIFRLQPFKRDWRRKWKVQLRATMETGERVGMVRDRFGVGLGLK